MTVLDTIHLAITGTPQPKERARRGRAGNWYTPTATAHAEERIKAAWHQQRPGYTPWLGPVTVTMHAYFAPPFSWPKWRREAAIRDEWPHLQKPDGDNLFKIIDALNGLAWADDSQVHAHQVTKHWSTQARTIITIELHQPLPARKPA